MIFNNSNCIIEFEIEIAVKWLPSLNTIVIATHFTELFHFYIENKNDFIVSYFYI